MEAIERRAEAVLATLPHWIWDGKSLPVPIADIADTRFGLLIRELGDLSAAPGVPALEPGQTLSGLLLADRGEIWVNAAEARRSPPRRRFTIGHELGHFCLHHSPGTTVYCRATSVDESATTGPRPALAVTEEEANAFAAALLMPARLVREHYRRELSFFELCDLFGTSGSAMGKRLHAVI